MGLLLKLARGEFFAAGAGRRSADHTVSNRGHPGDWTDPRVAPQDLGIAEIHTRGTVEDVLVAEAEALYLCVPMVWVFGARKEEIVTHALELLGCADARP